LPYHDTHRCRVAWHIRKSRKMLQDSSAGGIVSMFRYGTIMDPTVSPCSKQPTWNCPVRPRHYPMDHGRTGISDDSFMGISGILYFSPPSHRIPRYCAVMQVRDALSPPSKRRLGSSANPRATPNARLSFQLCLRGILTPSYRLMQRTPQDLRVSERSCSVDPKSVLYLLRDL